MKIVYFLKKGFQYYPPCLAQVLMLNDLGLEVEIYHGKNSEYINELFDSRKIKHHELKSDNFEKGKFASAKKCFAIGEKPKLFYQVYIARKCCGLETVSLFYYWENL